MSFQTNPHKFARLRTYGDAELFYNRVKPIRGLDKASVGVPLRDDRKYWQYYALKKRGDDYVVRMYHTDIAIFRPDGTTIIDASYGSKSTNAVVENFTPRGKNGSYAAGFYRRNKRPIVWFNGQDFWANKPIVFKDGEIINKDQLAAEKRVLNRKRAATVRKNLQPFFDYIRTMRTLSEDGLPAEMLPAWEGAGSSYDRDYTDPSNFPRLLRPFWMMKWFGGVKLAAIRDGVEMEILLAAYSREEAYDWVPLEEGTIHKTMRYVMWNEPNL